MCIRWKSASHADRGLPFPVCLAHPAAPRLRRILGSDRVRAATTTHRRPSCVSASHLLGTRDSQDARAGGKKTESPRAALGELAARQPPVILLKQDASSLVITPASFPSRHQSSGFVLPLVLLLLLLFPHRHIPTPSVFPPVSSPCLAVLCVFSGGI